VGRLVSGPRLVADRADGVFTHTRKVVVNFCDVYLISRTRTPGSLAQNPLLRYGLTCRVIRWKVYGVVDADSAVLRHVRQRLSTTQDCDATVRLVVGASQVGAIGQEESQNVARSTDCGIWHLHRSCAPYTYPYRNLNGVNLVLSCGVSRTANIRGPR